MKALLALALAVQAPAPAPPAGLVEQQHDTLATVAAEVKALPGSAGLAVYALDPGGPRPLFELDAAIPAPVGSSFKLWVLAEAVRQVRAGTRHWRDVVTLGPRALPSGLMQRWPAQAPVTLQTLATMMIAISDNTAADTLLLTLGRTRVDAMAAAAGTAARTLPLLTTREAAIIKADRALAAIWAKGSPAERRALLLARARRFATAPLDPTLFDGGPRDPETVEWFASPADMARTLDWLRRRGDRATQQILAVNPGLPPDTARRFAYVGYKGGSEPGVIAMNWLLNTRDGKWFALCANWHRADAPVDEAAFVALMARAAAVVAQR